LSFDFCNPKPTLALIISWKNNFYPDATFENEIIFLDFAKGKPRAVRRDRGRAESPSIISLIMWNKAEAEIAHTLTQTVADATACLCVCACAYIHMSGFTRLEKSYAACHLLVAGNVGNENSAVQPVWQLAFPALSAGGCVVSAPF